jgi:pyridinium-3,5-biscarboxylic acid mononucleotide sulfurtransferase
MQDSPSVSLLRDAPSPVIVKIMAHREKHERLVELIRPLKKALVAYSGGVDSSLLLKVAADVLTPRNVTAFIASSRLTPLADIDEAAVLARSLGVEPIVDEISPFEDDRFCVNDRERCYFCKTRMLSAAWVRAHEKGVPHVLEGSNADDGQDFRPGSRAVIERGVLSPLKAVGLSKAEIRLLSKELGLPTHDKPSDACLATRVPYGTFITGDLIARIALAEEFVRQEIGARQVRVRAHGGVARIEVVEAEIGSLLAKRLEIAEGLKRWGFIYVAVDLEGYRTGSMNEQEDIGEECDKKYSHEEG